MWDGFFLVRSGVAGILCYGCAVLCIVLYAFEKPVPATGILAVFVGVPLIAILLKEPLTNLLERKKKAVSGRREQGDVFCGISRGIV